VNFHIEDEAIDDATHVIELGGEVDLYTAPEFKERMVELIESGKKQIVVDLSKATFRGRLARPGLHGREHHEDLRDHRPRPGLPDPRLAGRGAGSRGLACRVTLSGTSTIARRGPLAQLVEQETLNLKVEGSSPSRPIAQGCLTGN
jgi:hypothetical protein